MHPRKDGPEMGDAIVIQDAAGEHEFSEITR
jgi:hypothetical protein